MGVYLRKPRPLLERFWEKVRRGEDCWTWTAGLTSYGYGTIGVGAGTMLAHRLAYVLTNGEIPEGMAVCHKCDNPPCVRPEHLFLGTRADNNRDRLEKGRYARGEARHSTGGKLITAQVLEIRRRWEAGESQSALAREFGVSMQSVHGIVHRRYWWHI